MLTHIENHTDTAEDFLRSLLFCWFTTFLLTPASHSQYPHFSYAHCYCDGFTTFLFIPASQGHSFFFLSSLFIQAQLELKAANVTDPRFVQRQLITRLKFSVFEPLSDEAAVVNVVEDVAGLSGGAAAGIAVGAVLGCVALTGTHTNIILPVLCDFSLVCSALRSVAMRKLAEISHF